VTGLRGVRRPVAVGVIALVGVLAAVLVLGLVLVRSGPAGAGGASPRSSFSLEQVLAFDEFELFSAGYSVDGVPLTAVLRRDDTATYVSFVYGDCEPESDAGCAPPAEVQVWPACRRSLALYDGEAAGSPVPERVHVRGVPGAFFDRGTRLELETGRSLVVVFAGSRAQALRVAAALEAVDGSVAAGAPLPPPAAGRGRGGARGC
jgi:hypothetical protein